MAKISRTFCLNESALKIVQEHKTKHGFKSDSEALESIITNEIKVSTNELKNLVTEIVKTVLIENKVKMTIQEVKKTENIIDEEVSKACQNSISDIMSCLQ